MAAGTGGRRISPSGWRAIGSRLILPRGRGAGGAASAGRRRPGAGAVCWSRSTIRPAWRATRDVKAGLQGAGLEARSFTGHSAVSNPGRSRRGRAALQGLSRPSGAPCKDRDVAAPLPGLRELAGAGDAGRRATSWTDWRMGAAMRRGADGRRPTCAGRRGGRRGAGCASFFETGSARYKADAGRPGRRTAPRAVREPDLWRDLAPHALARRACARCTRAQAGAETFLKELVWREFAWHLIFHSAAHRPAELARGVERLPLAQDNDAGRGAGSAAAPGEPSSMPRCARCT